MLERLGMFGDDAAVARPPSGSPRRKTISMRVAYPRSLLLVAPLAASLLAPGPASAQDEPPPLPTESESDSLGLGDEPETPAPAPPADSPKPATTKPLAEDPYAGGSVDERYRIPASSAAASATSTETPLPTAAPTDEADEFSRRQSMRAMSTLSGSLGLLRVQSASGGRAGQFRFGLLGSFFSQTGFLCTPAAPCADPVTGETTGLDSAQRIDAIANVSATPFPFLEAYLSIRNTATQNDRGRPQLLQVLGDSLVGVKGFVPYAPDRAFTFGGAVEMAMLTGTGGVGLNGGATGFALRALASLDLTNRTKSEDRFPLRAHANLGYFFDNSAAVVATLERTPEPLGRGEPIARTERFGLNVSRVDSLQIGLGAEYDHPWIRPFAEWTIDVPVNRQGYVCNIDGAASRGDWCLGAQAGIITTPSRFTLGARGYPWQESGLALTLAFDIGASGTRSFLEETKPEVPYAVWFGLAYGVDVVPPAPKVVVVEKPALDAPQEIRRYVVGRVTVQGTGAAIPDALVRFSEAGFTGMIADKDGYFLTTDLAPGEYTFQIYAAEYKPGTCSITVPETLTAASNAEPPSALESTPLGTETGPAKTARSAIVNEDGDYELPLECPLKELPKVANVIGLVVDSTNGSPVADASVTITDRLGRTLTLSADAQGSLLFKNVVFGTAQLVVRAPGYLPAVSVVTIDSRKEVTTHLSLSPRPAKSNVTVGPRQLKLARSISFVGETADIAPESMAMVEELAAFLLDNAAPPKVEIAVHSDDSGAASYARRLTQDRADRVRETLVRLGVDESRVVAKGYGPDEPLGANVSDAARAKNRRVEIRLPR